MKLKEITTKTKISIGVLIVTNLLTMTALFTISNKMTDLNNDLAQERIMAEKEKQDLLSTYFKVRNSTIKSMTKIQGILENYNSDGLSYSDKSTILDELKKLQDIADTRKSVELVQYATLDNFDIYEGIMSICHSIEKFNVYLAYGIDTNRPSAIDNATAEITEILRVIEWLSPFDN